MRSWGQAVGKLGMQLGKLPTVIRSQVLYTYFMRSMWVTNGTCARLFPAVCAQIIWLYQSVTSWVFPTNHSPYYNVYSFYSKKLINNTGASA